ncbi:molybdenum cofactor biosynthesis protein MoaB [Cytobacillus firmus]|uniref:MogA/MoaB family molybdenum cofactor biosynthesis protein n=1 Tax=Cytobacillus firmus TaxID=1399 RepID=UPI0018CE7441|nr:molybdenum cofactor biosynthesis protein B [Cytobacillus firmus]MBG9445840.1 molybdenum cofactor biosynthesis protein B [Cytobacillus firmus]MBG9448375.1 molybdenum cofactor biosynthesis protein B [Cytobacillus firmus]MBY6050913.1 molybdenum cofactor biosynthesis protein MoaB [Cytobacillus firmus]URT70075.1 molybdenum cofactor biosynthesis protein MoaB [Cytobacillus firmus]USK38208.1 molybdenum cofactor biosynthesis protein MoaB [Cytobacillus firmus]
MSTVEHKKEAPKEVRCKVITVSDTRDEETDKSGKLMIQLLEEAGHIIADYEIVKDEKTLIRQAVLKGCENPWVDAVLTNGGTGIALRDVTIETVRELFDKEIDGFGELFRMLSYTEDIGSAAILSRAAAGTVQNKAVFSTPGSSGAVRLAMNKLILPELGHIVRELRKDL